MFGVGYHFGVFFFFFGLVFSFWDLSIHEDVNGWMDEDVGRVQS